MSGPAIQGRSSETSQAPGPAPAEELTTIPPAASPASDALLEIRVQTMTPAFQGTKEHDRHVFLYGQAPRQAPKPLLALPVKSASKYSGPRGRRWLANLIWPNNPTQTLFWPHPHLHGPP